MEITRFPFTLLNHFYNKQHKSFVGGKKLFSENNYDIEFNFLSSLDLQLFSTVISFYDVSCLIPGRNSTSFTHVNPFFVSFGGCQWIRAVHRYSDAPIPGINVSS